VWDSVGDSVRASVGASVWASVGASVGASVRASVRDSVRASVGDSVRDSVRASVGKHAVYESPYDGCGGEAGWISWFDFLNRIGIENTNGERYKDWLLSGVWDVLWFESLAVITCRPSLIKKDENGRLHCDRGPAATWPNGEQYWFWHGARVSEKIIMRPQEITRTDILREKNSEVSRAIAERLGWDEYMKRADTSLVDKWFDSSKSLHYELWDFKHRFAMTPRLLKMESPELNDGTRPFYVEPVHPNLKSCQSARKWQFQKPNGTWPEPEECNDDPSLEFGIEA
jgi:hypothetical protein